jgi:hypothetical protein
MSRAFSRIRPFGSSTKPARAQENRWLKGRTSVHLLHHQSSQRHKRRHLKSRSNRPTRRSNPPCAYPAPSIGVSVPHLLRLGGPCRRPRPSPWRCPQAAARVSSRLEHPSGGGSRAAPLRQIGSPPPTQGEPLSFSPTLGGDRTIHRARYERGEAFYLGKDCARTRY